MEKIPGTIRVACTTELKKEIEDSGMEKCVLVEEEIKSIGGVSNVWHPNDKIIDFIVEIEVNDYAQSQTIVSQIQKIDGVAKAQAYVAVEV